MDFRIGSILRLDVALREPEERSADPALWFYIVDPEATAAEGAHVLQNGAVVLGLSAAQTDAEAVAPSRTLDVVYYSELGEAEQQGMKARIDTFSQSAPLGIRRRQTRDAED